MKKYVAIGSLRKLNVRIILNDNQVIYECITDDMPNDITHLEYSLMKNNGNGFDVYCYTDEYISSKELEQN